MSIKVNYIVANYIGPLRSYKHYQDLFSKDPLYFFKKHLDFIRTVHDPDNFRATFVFNDDIEDTLKTLLQSYIPDRFEIVFRKNSGFSYGIWNDIILKNLNNYDYFFLIEDDYIPTRSDFILPFKQRCVSKNVFVCGLVEKASPERFPGHVPPNEKEFKFPSISNGLLSAKACREVFNKHGTIFKINSNSDYWSAYTNQIYFCKYFTDMGYNIVDTLDEYESPYNNANSKDLVVYGQGKYPPLLTPIEVPRA